MLKTSKAKKSKIKQDMIVHSVHSIAEMETPAFASLIVPGLEKTVIVFLTCTDIID